MKIEKLRKNNSKRYFLCGLILVVVLTITVTFIGSKANYRMTASIPLTEGKVTASPYDINVVALYLDNVEQPKDTPIPISGYIINENDSFCCKGSNCKKEDKDTNVTLRTFAGLHIFRGISKGDKCYLYFDALDSSSAVTMSNLLENYYTDKRVRTSENKDFNVSFGEATFKTIFTAQDNDGTTYYFAGNPIDNWVLFGGYYWRIIRINGDGSIRLIYQGTEPNEKGKGTQITRSKFNKFDNDNAYVGFMYGSTESTTYERTHENTNNSTIKNTLDDWFENSNIKQGTDYFNKIDLDAGFCGDRELASKTGGYGTETTVYKGHSRLSTAGLENPTTIDDEPVIPTFNCARNNDLYTYSQSSKGNKVLTNPIGLITADEASYAGLLANWYDSSIDRETNFLNTGNNYFTLTPSHFKSTGQSLIRAVAHNGAISSGFSADSLGVRPVINLRSDTLFTGNGTITSPFEVVIS
ncbi:MAG: hypothetical protein NC483_05125 [Ruminococcus sp.]|nr:hypothetical protein [Ruminococcus sp.]